MSRIYGAAPGGPPALRPVRDLAGAPVRDVQGRSVGTLFGSLAEARSGLLRYLDVALEGEDRHVLVPVGHVRIEAENGSTTVRLQAATREDLQEIPPYEPRAGELDEEYQRALLAAHGRLFYGERYYAHPAYDHSGLFAGEHPIVHDGRDDAAAGPGDGAPSPGLRRMSGLRGYRVVPGEPDIRGWPLVAGNGVSAGWIRDLVVDADARKVRYVVAGLGSGGEVLLPIGFLQIDAHGRIVRVPALSDAELAELPRLTGPAIGRREEEEARRALGERLREDRRFDGPDFRPNGGPLR